MKSKNASKMLSRIVMACMAGLLIVVLTGCIPPSTIRSLAPTMGHWIYQKDDRGVEHKIGCAAGGNECAYVAIGCSKVEIPVSLAEKLIEWKANAPQL